MKNKFFNTTILGVKQNIVPGIFLLLFAILIVVTYYNVDSCMFIFDNFANLKTKYGFIYSGISTSIFAGIIPFCYLAVSKQIQKDRWIKILLFYMLFWIWRGVEVDFFYRLQDVMFGNTTDFNTIFKKVALDQFVYTPLWASPLMVIFFMWKDLNFNFNDTIQSFNRELFFFKIPSILCSTWLIWIPAVAIIYGFPSQLQIPIFNIIVCFWTLLFNAISKSNNTK